MGQFTFKIYRTVDVPFEDVASVLAGGQTGDEQRYEMWYFNPHTFPSGTPSAVIDIHRSTSVTEDVNEDLFVLIDSETWREDGVLVINLSFKGYVDALRMLPHRAGDCVPALTTTTNWTDSLRVAKRPLFPRHAFAVYLLCDEVREESNVQVEEVLRGLNEGFNGRKRLPPRKGDKPPVCVAARQSAHRADAIDDIKAQHGQAVEEEDLSPRYFIAVRGKDWAERNVVLVDMEGTDGKGTELTLGVETVGELVQWIWVGLTSIEEVVKESKNGEIGPKGLFICEE